MIYFIHGFDWPYDKELTVQINEFNQPDVSKDFDKVVVFPILKDLDSFKKYYINDKTLQFDKLVYKYKINEEEIIWNFGLIWNEHKKVSFWKGLKKLIKIILENYPETKNIRIPLSFFYNIYQNLPTEIFLSKLYKELSRFKKKIDFFILLEDGFNEIQYIYTSCEKTSEIYKRIYHENAKILSRLDQIDSLKKPYICISKDLGFGICDYFQLEQDFDNIYCFMTKFEENEKSIFMKLEPKLRKRNDPNFTTYIKNPLIFYNDWFLKKDYVEYDEVYKWAMDQNINFTNKEKESFFNIFGYIKDDDNSKGRIPQELNKSISSMTKKKSNKDIITEFSNFDSKVYEKIESHFSGNKLKELEKIWFKDGSSKWTEDKIRKFRSQRIKVNHKENSKYNSKYSIERETLFYWVLYLKLNTMQAKDLFRKSDCYLETHLLEDLSLIKILDNVLDSPSLFDDFISYYFGLYK